MYDLTQFRLQDMVHCGAVLRALGGDATHMEVTAEAVVRYLYDSLRDGPDGARACALVRLYKTHAYGDLEPRLRRGVGSGPAGHEPPAATKCLTLLATVGDEPAWNDRRRSAGHQAIPLLSSGQVAGIPMVAQLIRQFGLEVSSVLAPDPAIMLDLEQRTFNVFHVLQARDSPYIPAQADFVIPHGIASVLGFGGVLPSGDLVAALLFSKVSIPAGTAEFFKTIALNIKLALLPHDGAAIFAPPRRTVRHRSRGWPNRRSPPWRSSSTSRSGRRWSRRSGSRRRTTSWKSPCGNSTRRRRNWWRRNAWRRSEP